MKPLEHEVESPTKVPSGLVKQLVEYVVGRGVERYQLLAQLGVEPAALNDIDAWVDLAAFDGAVEHGMKALADPLLGIHYIDAVGFASLDATGFLSMASPTVGDSLSTFAAHHNRLVRDEFRLELDGERVSFTYRPRGPVRAGQSQRAEMYAAGVLILAARYGECEVAPLSLRFTHAAWPGAELGEYRRLLGRVPDFNADANEWSFSSEVLERAMSSSNPALATFFQSYVCQRLAPKDERCETRVRAVLEDLLPKREASLVQVARSFGYSPRTLQRHLRTEGTSFEEILNDERKARATVLLSSGKPISEVSYLLGYSDPISFHHAFKRWNGVTPDDWRLERNRRA